MNCHYLKADLKSELAPNAKFLPSKKAALLVILQLNRWFPNFLVLGTLNTLKNYWPPQNVLSMWVVSTGIYPVKKFKTEI